MEDLIGGNMYGEPSKTLIIEGYEYKAKDNPQSLLIIDYNKLIIKSDNLRKYLLYGNPNNISMVTGIPMLVQKGKIMKDLLSKTSSFYTKTHARTAIGIDSDGKIIILVVEQKYRQSSKNKIRRFPNSLEYVCLMVYP